MGHACGEKKGVGVVAFYLYFSYYCFNKSVAVREIIFWIKY